MTTTGRLLSAGQVAEILKVSVRTVRRMADDGRLPVYDRHDGNGAYLFEREAIADLAAASAGEAS